jgi:PAS domain S-box-containing protein
LLVRSFNVMIDTRVLDLAIPEVPLSAFVLEHARGRGEKCAIVDGLSGASVSYLDLCMRVDRAAAGLVACGLQKGDVVAIYSPNVPEYAVAYYAIAHASGIITTINPLFTVTELRHQLKDSGARFLMTTPELFAVACQAMSQTGIERIFTFGNHPDATDLATLGEVGSAVHVPIDPRREIVALPYSSGTTGLPKGVMLTHHNIVANIVHMAAVEQLTDDEVLIATLPFYHIYGMVAVMNAALRAGATVVTMSRFDVKSFLQVLQNARVTTAYVAPPLVRMLAKHPVVAEYDLSALKDVISGAATLRESDAHDCATRLGCTVRQAYGLTETSSVTHIMPRRKAALGVSAVGFAVPNTGCRVVDVASRRDVATGELGEIWVRGPQVMVGYLNNPEATRDMLDPDGWLHTGDIGYVDENGLLSVADRAKDLIKFRSLQYGDNELLLAMVEDIGARRRTEQRVTFQALLLDNVRESVVAADHQYRVTFWNKGAEALFGYPAEEALNQPLAALILPQDEDSAAQWESEMSALREHGRWQGQSRRRRKNGDLLWTDIVASSVTDTSGSPHGVVAIHRDITDLRHSQLELKESRERLRNLASSLIEVRERERSALARDLHDELGQALTKLNMDLCWMLARLPRYLNTARAQGMVPLVRSILETVQHICAQLRPAILDDLGLEAAIEWQAKHFADWNGRRCRLDLRLKRLKPHRDRDTAVFRILQEALTNVARHAHAKEVVVSARAFKQELVLEVRDDGVGIPREKLASTQSLGLIGMRERAVGIGGQLHLQPRPSGGTTIVLRVPLEPPASANEGQATSY